MNRKLMFGITAFFAVVGLALVGGEKEAFAGRGCHGRVAKRCGGLLSGGLSKIRCRGVADCCGVPAPDPCPPKPTCRGAKKCHGGLFARLKAHRDARCRGVKDGCGDPAPDPCCKPKCCKKDPCCKPKCCKKDSCSGDEAATKEESAEADDVPEPPTPEEV